MPKHTLEIVLIQLLIVYFLFKSNISIKKPLVFSIDTVPDLPNPVNVTSVLFYGSVKRSGFSLRTKEPIIVHYRNPVILVGC